MLHLGSWFSAGLRVRLDVVLKIFPNLNNSMSNPQRMLAAVPQWAGFPCGLSHLATLSTSNWPEKDLFKILKFFCGSHTLVFYHTLISREAWSQTICFSHVWMDGFWRNKAANEYLRKVSSSWVCSYETLLSCGDTGVKYDAVVGFCISEVKCQVWKISCLHSLTSRQEGACGFVAAAPHGTTETWQLTYPSLCWAALHTPWACPSSIWLMPVVQV